MSKSGALGVFLSLVACAGVSFGVVEIRKMSATLTGIEDRLGKVEQATGTPAPGATSATGSSTASTPATLTDVAQEVSRLKAELASVKTEQGELSEAQKATAAKVASGGKTGGGTVSSADVEQAVNQVLAAKEKERAEADAKRQQDMVVRAQAMVVDNLAKELGLTEQQKTQVSEIVSAQFATMRTMWTDRKDGDDPRAKMEELRKDTDAKVKAILTTEQQTKYDELAQRPGGAFGGGMMGGFGGRRRGGDNGGGGDSGGGGR